MNIRIPGPTPFPSDVAIAIQNQVINHRSEEYKKMHAKIVASLKHFFQTNNDIYLYTSSGTGGLEAGVVNFFSPKDTVLFLTCGIFGERWADCARAYGLRVIQKKFSYGSAVDPEYIIHITKKNNNIRGIFITHNETSTGVLNPVKEISKIVKQLDCRPLLLVDAVSSLGAVDLRIDDWAIDVAITASQKAWMSPPGISMVSVSKKALRAHKMAKLPRYYFDLSLMKEYASKNQTPATPALTTLFGLQKALDLMMKEGKDNVFRRHLQLRDFFRKHAREIGWELLVNDVIASPTVTSLIVPGKLDSDTIQENLERNNSILVGGGLGELKKNIIRVAHMGHVSEKDLLEVISALQNIYTNAI